MNSASRASVKDTCARFHNDRTRLMDIVRAIHATHGYVDDETIDLIAASLSIERVEVAGMVTFYSFFSTKPRGKIMIRLCNDVIDRLNGSEAIAEAFRTELGIDFGGTTPDGKISLEYASCIGMSDQAPAALVNDQVVTYLSTDRVKEIVATLRKTGDPDALVHRLGDGNNATDLVRSMVHNNLRRRDEVIFGEYTPNDGLAKALALSPVEVINEIKTARLRGRGGAGFPTGMKWEFTRAAEGDRKFVICNSDEGEPGTFKDRVLITELADRILEGMTITGYAIGASEGIFYLRGEYAYLHRLVSTAIEARRKLGLLGKGILGKEFSFDIQIQLGAGAYVCGEETALISSMEGGPGLPKTRPPFPAQKGYLGLPTVVNNAETLCVVPSILDRGAGWFARIGAKNSTGTKLLSIAGDCRRPGVYEYPFGVRVADILKEVGAEDPIALQIGGASGQMIGEGDFGRTICFEDLATGGSIMIFGRGRDLLDIVRGFTEFFVEENCGYCTPCRVGTRLLQSILNRVLAGHGTEADLSEMRRIGSALKNASRCGLGQTAANPILSTLEKFRPLYDRLIQKPADGLLPSFDASKALAESVKITGRRSTVLT